MNIEKKNASIHNRRQFKSSASAARWLDPPAWLLNQPIDGVCAGGGVRLRSKPLDRAAVNQFPNSPILQLAVDGRGGHAWRKALRNTSTPHSLTIEVLVQFVQFVHFDQRRFWMYWRSGAPPHRRNSFISIQLCPYVTPIYVLIDPTEFLVD